MDANIGYLTWINTDNLPPQSSNMKLKSLIDDLFLRIIPLGVSQVVKGATRAQRGQVLTMYTQIKQTSCQLSVI